LFFCWCFVVQFAALFLKARSAPKNHMASDTSQNLKCTIAKRYNGTMANRSTIFDRKQKAAERTIKNSQNGTQEKNEARYIGQ